MKTTKTQRGFSRIEFEDFYSSKCSIQKSSLADDDCIWIGEDVLIKTSMHLNREQVAELLPYLQKFVKTGEI